MVLVQKILISSCHLIRFWTWTKTNILLFYVVIRYKFFWQLPWYKSICVSLFYLLSRPTQKSCAGWAFLLVLSKHSFKFGIESSAQFISRWSKIVEFWFFIKTKNLSNILHTFWKQLRKKILPSLSHIMLITWRIN